MENITDEKIKLKMAELLFETWAKICNRLIEWVVNIRDFFLALFGKLEYAAVC